MQLPSFWCLVRGSSERILFWVAWCPVSSFCFWFPCCVWCVLLLVSSPRLPHQPAGAAERERTLAAAAERREKPPPAAPPGSEHRATVEYRRRADTPTRDTRRTPLCPCSLSPPELRPSPPRTYECGRRTTHGQVTRPTLTRHPSSPADRRPHPPQAGRARRALSLASRAIPAAAGGRRRL